MTNISLRAAARRYVPRFHMLELGFFVVMIAALGYAG